MEPKLENDSGHYNFPSEPSLNGSVRNRGIPKIVPADLKNPPAALSSSVSSVSSAPVAPAVSVAPAAQTDQSSGPQKTEAAERPKNPKALMASLSKDINELSTPLKKAQPEPKPSADPLEHFGEKGSDGVILPPEDDLGDPLDPSPTSSVIRSILLFICLCFVIVAAWQVTLFLQPEILRSEPLNSISEKSCDYFYCPPLRTPVVLTNQVNAVSPGHWELKIQVQNQDMRTQKLPVIQLTLEGTASSTTQKIFEPGEYRTDPNIENIPGGGTANIIIPFTYDEGRPTSYKVKVLEN